MTYREIAYMCLDELKIQSDDAYYEESHMIFLLEKYRSLLLRGKYGDKRNMIPDANLQLLPVTLSKVYKDSVESDYNLLYLKSTIAIPRFLSLTGLDDCVRIEEGVYGNSREIAYVNRNRFKYVNANKWLQKCIYATRNDDGYLYITSGDTDYKDISSLRITACFDNPKEVYSITNSSTDILDLDFPMESSMVPSLIKLVVSELLGYIYRPKDESNDAKDDLTINSIPIDTGKRNSTSRFLSNNSGGVEQ